mgnify:CR=1 FL=1
MEDLEQYGYQLFLSIEDVRLFYDHTCSSIEKWSGAPARPVEEQEFLRHLKSQLFAMLADHTFNNG